VNEHRISAQQAGYLELPGAVKDADCEVVEVDGGVSSERGCCNSFGWKSRNVHGFKCGECKYLADREGSDGEERPIGRREAGKMSDREILDSDRPVKDSGMRDRR
jgi:hypothetical protein